MSKQQKFTRTFDLKSLFTIDEFNSRLKKITKENKNAIAVDIGCGIPTYLFELIMVFGFKKGIGIDKENDFDKMLSLVNNRLYKNCKSFKDCYKNYLKHLVSQKVISNFKKTICLREFDSKFDLDFGEEIQDYNINKLPNFELTFLINLLHLIDFKDGIDIINKLIPKLSNKGLILIEVNHIENRSYTNKDYVDFIKDDIVQHKITHNKAFLYSDERFLNLIDTLESSGICQIIKPIKIINRISNKVNSMLYIGEKNELNKKIND